MKMTNKLANTLMDTLVCVAISANGGAKVDEDGNIIVTDEDFQQVIKYARKTFDEILTPWEKLMGEDWEIEEGDDDEDEE